MAAGGDPSGGSDLWASFVIDRIFAAVRRSTCESHFNEFQYSNNHQSSAVSSKIARLGPVAQNQLCSFFRASLYKINEETWLQFQDWLGSDMGLPIQPVGLQWSRFGIRNLKYCAACRGVVDLDWEGSSDLPLSDSVWLAVERSMRTDHFSDFKSFHNSFLRFAEKIDADHELVGTYRSHFQWFFGEAPKKRVQRLQWLMFRWWMKHEGGKRYRKFCHSWPDYGLATITACCDCKIASLDDGNDCNSDETDESEEDPSDEEYETDKSQLTAKLEDIDEVASGKRDDGSSHSDVGK